MAKFLKFLDDDDLVFRVADDAEVDDSVYRVLSDDDVRLEHEKFLKVGARFGVDVTDSPFFEFLHDWSKVEGWDSPDGLVISLDGHNIEHVRSTDKSSMGRKISEKQD